MRSPFLEALIKKRIPRFIAYRDVQRVAFEAHEKKMNYMDALINDKTISKSLTEKEIRGIFIPGKHLGASQIIINNEQIGGYHELEKWLEKNSFDENF